MKIRGLIKKKMQPSSCSAVIVAAGSSNRMGSDKIFLNLGNMPVLARTLLAYEQCELIDEIILVVRKDRLAEAADLCKQFGIGKISKVLSGGDTRTQSVLVGVSEVKSSAKMIAIHDGARPLITQDVICRAVHEAEKHLAVVPVISSTDTLKTVDENGRVLNTVDRSCTVRVQTPQVFDASLIKGALTKAVKDGLNLTDDCAAIEMMGVKTYTVMGDEDNIKLTTPRDMMIAAAILRDRGENIENRSWV